MASASTPSLATLERAPIMLRRSEVKRNLGIDIRAEMKIEQILSSLGFRCRPPRKSRRLTQRSGFRPGASTSSAKSTCWKSWRASTATTSFPTRCRRSSARWSRCPTRQRTPRSARPCWRSAMTKPSRSRSSPSRSQAPSDDGEPLALANPLSEEAGYMRTSLLPGLLNMVGYNLNRGTTNVRLFEAGEVFEKTGDESRRTPPPRLCRDRRRARQDRPLAGPALHVLPHEGRHRGVAGGLPASVAALRHATSQTTSIPAARRAP